MDIDLDLYNQHIMQLAARAQKNGALPRPFTHHAQKTSPLCGSRVECGFNLEHGIITDLAFITKACLLGSAAAVISQDFALGKDIATIQTARDKLHNMLKNNAPPPDGIYEPFAIFAPCVAHRARHAAILLSLECLLLAD